jgi:hypothetical protein
MHTQYPSGAGDERPVRFDELQRNIQTASYDDDIVVTVVGDPEPSVSP